MFLIVYTTFLCHKGVVRINEIMSPLEYFPRENAREWAQSKRAEHRRTCPRLECKEKGLESKIWHK